MEDVEGEGRERETRRPLREILGEINKEVSKTHRESNRIQNTPKHCLNISTQHVDKNVVVSGFQSFTKAIIISRNGDELNVCSGSQLEVSWNKFCSDEAISGNGKMLTTSKAKTLAR